MTDTKWLDQSTDYGLVRGHTIDDAVVAVAQYDQAQLVRLIVNNRLNNFLSDYADEKLGDTTMPTVANGHGKRIPYLGWYYRPVDWVGRRIPIARCAEGFVGIIENNKWGYPQRYLTTDEADKVIMLAWEAMMAGGNNWGETLTIISTKLSLMWDLFQTFDPRSAPDES